ncbi:hypothetical protein H6G76_18020 [Nostoc sp. FACHB-152]|uniref:hypothetical protein n=1 Tax=unclassified Nostoc TaxID=2593658 RepID=UPI001684325E|nr:MULTISPECIES: hypothetical protein [unclassified Nostoc]MBD2449017.1 hypothetical protein [Nostoc sp. FACHB-152]MBD2469747.1 hypothetical protein [Nostoc sp. FACHB-145]
MKFFLLYLAIIFPITGIRQNFAVENFASMFVILMDVDTLVQDKSEKQAKSFLIEYSAPTVSMKIKNLELTWVVRTEKYKNPISAIPNQITTETKSRKLTNAQLEQLKKLIQSNGFMNLRAEYGAPINQRYYPYSILVRNGKQYQKVLYRSNPAFGNSPQAFQQVESYLQQLIK